MRDETLQPIYSTKAEDPELLEPISDFVIALAPEIDRLQDIQEAADYQQLRTQCTLLQARCLDMGYPHLAEIAEEVAVACSLEKEESIHLGLLAITDLARRVRLGHRGAA